MDITKLSGEIVFVKVISGDYVVGKVLESDKDSELVLYKPLTVRFEAMMGGLQVVPYDAFYIGKELDEVGIKEEHIMHIFVGSEVPEEIKAKWTEISTGIVTEAQPEIQV